MVARNTSRPVKRLCKVLVKNLINKWTLAWAWHTCYACDNSKRNIYINILKIILPCASYLNPASRLSTLCRYRYLDSSWQICACKWILARHNIRSSSCCDNFSTISSCAWSDIHNIIGCKHSILIMFNDNNWVTKIAQMCQSSKQLVIIPLVKPDTWLIKNISNSYKTWTNLCCKPDSLCFTAWQSSCGTRKCQIIKPYIYKELNSRLDFLKNLCTNKQLSLWKLHILKKFLKLYNRHVSNLIYVLICNSNSKWRRLKSLSVTGRTRSYSHKFLILLLSIIRICLSVSSLHILNKTFKCDIIYTLSALAFIFNLYRMSLSTIDNNILNIIRIILEWCL